MTSELLGDEAGAETAVRDLLKALGVDVQDDVIKETPRRVAVALARFLNPPPFDLTTFPNTEGYEELILAKAIGFHSLCKHHLLPFAGVAHVAYVPGERLVGLSKLARVVELHARRLQVQEEMTAQIAACLAEHLQPKGVGVVVEAEHMCMAMRGVRKPGTRIVTRNLHGLIRDDPAVRQEFLSLVSQRSG